MPQMPDALEANGYLFFCVALSLVRTKTIRKCLLARRKYYRGSAAPEIRDVQALFILD
jgi:hypothetical protein